MNLPEGAVSAAKPRIAVIAIHQHRRYTAVALVTSTFALAPGGGSRLGALLWGNLLLFWREVLLTGSVEQLC